MASCIHRRRRIGRFGVGSDTGAFGGSWSCTTTLTFDSSDETERSSCKGACVEKVVLGASLRDTFRACSFPSKGGGMRTASSSRTGVCTLCVDGIRVLGSDGTRSKRPLLLASSSSIRATLMLPSALTSVGSLIGRLASGAFRRADDRRGGMAQRDGKKGPFHGSTPTRIPPHAARCERHVVFQPRYGWDVRVCLHGSPQFTPLAQKPPSSCKP